ncbi:Sulfotransferase domain protein [Maioricimonas rarisocia]|uniref:Sulfotransferase domain protein n=1 Tax=Maioricimonas rarisocia TaxID=2528026 RepID=A0A517Z8K2_9PLAN|nr:sulfotransferase [Maioricimonas rarisocia]QDU38820.1 Sulfotransferase domain protein [Maioricimonas rarisocia]
MSAQAVAASRMPNFFIVGAPKAGTTAFHTYLASHPDVVMSRWKEPNYFADDLSDRYREVRSLEQYQDQFAHAGGNEAIVGESSAMYMTSEVAIPRIRESVPDARVLVLLRNPPDLAHAFHNTLVLNRQEDVLDFPAAWRLQDRRRRGLAIPSSCLEPMQLMYRDIASLGTQLQRVLNHFPREQVHVEFFEDFAADTPASYARVQEFLELPHIAPDTFARMNPSSAPRSRLLLSLLDRQRIPLPLRRLGRRVGLDRLHWKLVRLNRKRRRRPELPNDFRRELIEEFADEVRLLEKLTHRDLSHWRACPPSG